jgi:hypothetical protein
MLQQIACLCPATCYSNCHFPCGAAAAAAGPLTGASSEVLNHSSVSKDHSQSVSPLTLRLKKSSCRHNKQTQHQHACETHI